MERAQIPEFLLGKELLAKQDHPLWTTYKGETHFYYVNP